MGHYVIGHYIYIIVPEANYTVLKNWSDISPFVVNYDNMLHRSLDKNFLKLCLGSSDKIKEFLRSPELKTIMKPILEKEPAVNMHFPEEKFRQLPLLWIAALAGYDKSAELLVRSGADVNEPFGSRNPQVIDEKWTILHLLIRMDFSPEKERLIRLVMDHGADLDVGDCRGQTVLHYTVNKSLVQMTEMLLKKGANVNAADNNGETSLFIAVKHSDEVMVPLLLKYGADVSAKSNDGRNVLHYLDHNSKKSIVNLARVLIEKGASLDVKAGDDFCQPIHLAAQYNRHNELVELFLDHGANVDALAVSGKSPLFIAAQSGSYLVIESLIKRGANVNLRTTSDGYTALHVACINAVSAISNSRRTDFESVIRLLLFARADLLVEDLGGNTPFALILSRQNRIMPETRLVIEALALRKSLQPSIVLKDESIIKQNWTLRDYYEKCFKEIEYMKCTKLIKTCTFFELLTISQYRIAMFMQNPEFETKFKLYDLKEFTIYAEDIRRRFKSAQKLYLTMQEQVDVINEATYNILPYLIVKRVIYYMFD